MNNNYIIYNGQLYHAGVKGMRWGVRKYQNEDGTLTEAGKKRYGKAPTGVTADQVAERDATFEKYYNATGEKNKNIRNNSKNKMPKSQKMLRTSKNSPGINLKLTSTMRI